MLKTCANPNCKQGENRLPKEFEPGKAWGLYCRKQCGDAVRRLRAYYKHKEAAEGRTSYQYGPLTFLPGPQQHGWVNTYVDGPNGRVSLWLMDADLPTKELVVWIIHALREAYFNPQVLIQEAGDDVDQQQEAKNLIKAAEEIGMPLIDAARFH